MSHHYQQNPMYCIIKFNRFGGSTYCKCVEERFVRSADRSAVISPTAATTLAPSTHLRFNLMKFPPSPSLPAPHLLSLVSFSPCSHLSLVLSPRRQYFIISSLQTSPTLCISWQPSRTSSPSLHRHQLHSFRIISTPDDARNRTHSWENVNTLRRY